MIPFYRPYYDYRELLAALRPGPARRKFEAAVAARAGARYGVAFAYGRAGLVAAFKALGVTQAEVILPAYTCLVMAHAVLVSGNRPAFVDIDLADYNMDVGALKRALSPRTRAVVATHMYGYPTDVDAIRSAVGDERVLVIEDCALALHPLLAGGGGLRGDLGFFSFGAGKPLTIYEGGVLVTDSPALYEQIRAYRDREMHRASLRAWAVRWRRFLSSYLLSSRRLYDVLYRPKTSAEVNRKFQMPPDYMPPDAAVALPHFQARVGLAQLHKADQIAARRRALARLYDQALDCPGVSLAPIVEGATYAYYTIRVPRRDEINFEARMIRRGVAVDRSYHYALPYLAAYRPSARGEFPNAARAAREVINLPCYPHLRDADARYIAASVLDAVLASKI
ncbi:MAG TPA: DegT/DnrJ/EryC1/StrS aminotransferase family protein [Chloroflexi bacterium]|nr:DegT/DnrJ/EryC1/StrS aminotransferase family protein [Chloroflexota bacterium]